MTAPVPASPNSSRLRRRAEAQLGQSKRSTTGATKSRTTSKPTSDSDPRRLLHELQVHQIELEMQNAELREARDELEVALEKYTDLYDFAPSGYFSLNAKAEILQLNLTGASLVGKDRSHLTGQSFTALLAPQSRTDFTQFLKEVFTEMTKHSRDFELLVRSKPSRWVNIEAQVLSAQTHCRAVVVDITAQRAVEEANRRLEVMTASNRKLEREIARRRALEKTLISSQQQLRELSREILIAQETERRRISRELHDTVVQTLVGVQLHLTSLTQHPTTSPKLLREKIARTQTLVGGLLSMVHRFAVDLRPSALDDLGLIPALHTFLKDFMSRTGIRSKLTASAEVNQLPIHQSSVLYRVALEALNNVAMHAHAKTVHVQLTRLPGSFCMKITDDGQSFNVRSVLQSNGNGRLGLIGMRERLEMIDGRFAIKSSPGLGTTVIARIPAIL